MLWWCRILEWGTELSQSPPGPLLVPSSQLQCPLSPWMRLSQCPSVIPAALGSNTENYKSFRSTLRFVHPGVGGEPKSVWLCLQQCLGGLDEAPGMELGWGRVVPRAECLSHGLCRSYGVEWGGEDAQGTPCPQILGTGAQSQPFPLQSIYPNSPPGALGFCSNKFICHVNYNLLIYHLLGRRGELALDPSSPKPGCGRKQVGSAHGSVLPSHQVLFPNAA